jgi:hypothetical protein
VPSESLFSKAEEIISAKRNKLKAELAEKLVLLSFDKTLKNTKELIK